MKKLFLFSLLVIGIHFQSLAQLTVNTTTYVNPTPAQSLVQDVLLGPGVTGSNFTFIGDPSQIGFFKSINTNLGIDSGIVMTSGDVNMVPGNQVTLIATSFNSTIGDPDLATILSNSPIPVQGVNDVAILEFDFVPQGDSVKFEYVFASEEYDDFVCDFNDVFGLFISGPGIAGPYTNGAENIALVPGTNQEVSITTINNGDSNGSCAWAPQNQQFYIDNTGNADNTFDAFTTVLTARSIVTCGQTYHVKMAICDAGDWSYDSGIFLRAKSFFSNAVSVSAATLSGDSTIVEGCAYGSFVFNRPGDLSDTLDLNITITGTAANGTDYTGLPNSVTFLPGEDEFVLTVEALEDFVTEGAESITISFLQIFCGVLDTVTTTLWIVPRQPLVLTIDTISPGTCPGQPITLSLNYSGGYPPYTFLWSTGETTPTIVINGTQPTTIWVAMSDTCGPQTVTDTVTVNPFVPLPLNVTVNPSIISCLTAPSTLTASTTGGVAPYNYVWYEAGFFVGVGATLNINPSLSTTYMVIVNDACFTTEDTAYVDVIVGPAPITISASTLSGDSTVVEGCAFGTFTFTRPGFGGPQLDLPIIISGFAGNGTDYTLLNDTVTFAAGQNIATLLLEALSDGLPEINESVTLSIVQDLCGVPDTASATLYIVPRQPITVDISQFTPPTCPGDPITLTMNYSGGYPPYSFLWSDGSTGNSIVVSPTSSTSYWVTVTDTCGPQTEGDTVIVVVPNPGPINVTATQGNIVCPNGNDTLFASATGGFPPLVYTWSVGGVNIGTGTSIIVNPSATTSYVVTVSDACGSSIGIGMTGVVVEPYITPSVNLVSSDAIVCPDDVIQIFAQGSNGVAPYSYTWNGASTAVTDSLLSVSSASNTFYYAFITDACNQNSIADTLEYIIPVYDLITVLSEEDTTVCPGALIDLVGTSSGGAGNYTYAWSNISGPDAVTSGSNGAGVASMTGSSVFRLTSTDQCGNSGFQDVEVDVREVCDVEEINVFTPNGDGSNQKLVFKNLELFPPSKLIIYNRWGNQVYSSDAYKNDWEGDNLSPGTYFYLLTIGGEPEPKNGFFKLMR
jgi:gliding motility-associated-like protein